MMHEVFGDMDLASVPVRNKAHEVLKRSIIEGKLAPGERLVESRIAEGLRISRTPLREAILRLEAEGFLQRQANGAVQVKPLSVVDVRELYAARSVLAGLVVREAATRLSKAQLDRLAELTGHLSEVAESSADVPGVARIGEEFHQTIVEASGNRTCADLLRGLRDRIAHYRHLTMTIPGRRRAAARELGAVLECLRRRDPAGAERAMRRHVLRAGRCMIQQLDAGRLGRGGLQGRASRGPRESRSRRARRTAE